MDASVQDQAMHRFARNLAPDRIETGKDDRVGGVVDEHRHARGRFEGPDVAAFPADDASL
jgi:hypothetical protein